MPLSHIAGFDDSPFERTHRGDVTVVGTVYSGSRLDGVLRGRVRRDGADSARNLARLVAGSRFHEQLHLVMLQGIALAGFNVVDVEALHAELELPVLVVARREPRMDAIREALLTRVPGGARKWKLIERLGPMEPIAGVFVQRVGLSATEAEEAIRNTAIHGLVPEPLRAAHLIAGAIATGHSRGRT